MMKMTLEWTQKGSRTNRYFKWIKKTMMMNMNLSFKRISLLTSVSSRKAGNRIQMMDFKILKRLKISLLMKLWKLMTLKTLTLRKMKMTISLQTRIKTEETKVRLDNP